MSQGLMFLKFIKIQNVMAGNTPTNDTGLRNGALSTSTEHGKEFDCPAIMQRSLNYFTTENVDGFL
jgi:hypothetical protein